MAVRSLWAAGPFVVCSLVFACGERRPPLVLPDVSVPADASFIVDSSVSDVASSPDGDLVGGACAEVTETAGIVRLPTDIIWVIDNSSSMEPAIVEVQRGLNDFSRMVAASDLDYRVIVVSLRGRGAVGSRYGVCVPRPLAGDTMCGNGERFFHTSVDIRSTQPLEQFLGTLGETSGYRIGESYGAARGEVSWRAWLREDAIKTIVVVTDDNARMVTRDMRNPRMGDSDPNASPTATADFFEHYAGGPNPFNGTGSTSTRALPAGILEPVWRGLFDNYRFHAIYGWGSTRDPDAVCEYDDGTSPPSPGPTYTALTERRDGVRAKICDDSRAWDDFFGEVARDVVTEARISCEVELPTPSTPGVFVDPARVNVYLDGVGGRSVFRRVDDAARCSASQWHYDDPRNPRHVVLCPAACESVRASAAMGRVQLKVEFGCASLI